MLGIDSKILLNPVQNKHMMKLNARKTIQNLSFTGGVKIITPKYDNVDFSSSKAADEILKQYEDFLDVPVCTGRTQYFDTREAQLYRLLVKEIEKGNRDVVNIVLKRLNLIGPVGYMKDTYAQVKIPYFEKDDAAKIESKDAASILESFAVGEGLLDAPQKTSQKGSYIEFFRSYIERKIHDVEKKKESYDKLLEYRKELKFFASEFIDAQEGKNTLLPNCILFVKKDNLQTVYDSVNWLKGVLSEANFGFIEGKYSDLEEYREKFQNELIKAKEEFTKTGKRSILFVPHLDDLADTRKNTSEDIAQMKYLLQAANDEFRTTVIFYTTPEKMPYLDKGILKSNRVGLVLGA